VVDGEGQTHSTFPPSISPPVPSTTSTSAEGKGECARLASSTSTFAPLLSWPLMLPHAGSSAGEVESSKGTELCLHWAPVLFGRDCRTLQHVHEALILDVNLSSRFRNGRQKVGSWSPAWSDQLRTDRAVGWVTKREIPITAGQTCTKLTEAST